MTKGKTKIKKSLRKIIWTDETLDLLMTISGHNLGEIKYRYLKVYTPSFEYIGKQLRSVIIFFL